jgi:thiamine pyrophosphate-dependent acetolactate synthase large subunit-like protein
MDSVPLIAITGQVPSSVIATDAFQESDVVGVMIPAGGGIADMITSVEKG